VKFWGSPDLKKWTQLGEFGKEFGAHGGVWECPDLFPISVEGSGAQKWVLLQSINPGAPNGGSGTQYFVGDFDGKNFSLDPGFARDVQRKKAVWLDWGRDNYAGVTWSDIPASDGRRLFMGWMSNWDYAQAVPTANWRSAMTLPRELVLKNTVAGLRLYSRPVKELENLRGASFSLESQNIAGALDLSARAKIPASASELQLEIEIPPGEKPDFGMVLSNTKGESYRVGFDAARNEFYSDRTRSGKIAFPDNFAAKRHAAPRTDSGRTIRLHLFFDRASCELFADDGATVMTDVFFPNEDFNRIQLQSDGGQVRLTSGVWWQLK